MAKVYTIKPTERTQEMIEFIKVHQGLKTSASAITFAIGSAYLKINPPHLQRRGGVNEDPDVAARLKVDQERREGLERAKRKTAEAARVCDVLLHGTVVDMEDGQHCIFHTYNFDDADEQNIPLEMATVEFAKHQKVTKPKK